MLYFEIEKQKVVSERKLAYILVYHQLQENHVKKIIMKSRNCYITSIHMIMISDKFFRAQREYLKRNGR